ncbi:MAG TPA: twin-arginine translocation signal domain-containing protein [Candidatus Dormibacteraeota bacterium]|nr:twin-arginine translocation signal domain-containing protein [Candidatus Dormibacteraeota bacterium]
MSKRIDRRTFVKTAAAGSVAAAALPLLGTSIALAGDSDDDDGGSRIYVYVSFSQAPAAKGLAQPRIGMSGAGTFQPAAKRVNGGGNYVLFDNAVAIPKPLVASGRWKARRFVSYTTKDLASKDLAPYGTIQPGILKMTADVEGIGKGLALTVVCNVGAQGPAGATGEEEGWELEGTPYGTFHQAGVGISHLSIEGFRIGGD